MRDELNATNPEIPEGGKTICEMVQNHLRGMQNIPNEMVQNHLTRCTKCAALTNREEGLQSGAIE